MTVSIAKLLAAGALLALVSCSIRGTPSPENTSHERVDFIAQVLPIFKARCIECHGDDEPAADLRLDIREGLFVEKKSRWTVIPGDAKNSPLVARIALPKDDDEIMPAEGEPLSSAEIGLITRWIDEGAVWPKGGPRPKPIEFLTYELDSPAPTKAQEASVEQALDRIRSAGGSARVIAANTKAIEVNLRSASATTTEALLTQMAELAPLLVRLDLSRTRIRDASLQTIGGFRELRRLDLSRTSITDAGLGDLKELQKLHYLNLVGTQITDAGMHAIGELKQLRTIYLWDSKVSAKGAAALSAKAPNLRVDRGGYAALAAKIAPKVEKKASNEKCPVTGKPVVATHVAEYQGKTIGFCCAKCRATFLRAPKKFAAKLR